MFPVICMAFPIHIASHQVGTISGWETGTDQWLMWALHVQKLRRIHNSNAALFQLTWGGDIWPKLCTLWNAGFTDLFLVEWKLFTNCIDSPQALPRLLLPQFGIFQIFVLLDVNDHSSDIAMCFNRYPTDKFFTLQVVHMHRTILHLSFWLPATTGILLSYTSLSNSLNKYSCFQYGKKCLWW